MVCAALLSVGLLAPAFGRDPQVPQALRQVSPLLQAPDERLFADLVYEGNNALMRREPGAPDLTDGAAVARRWRDVARRSGGLFVLRDSLWNQQDHPTHTSPYRLMLPPSWLLVAATRPAPTPVRWFDERDDAGWASLTDPGALFGAYPSSATLFELAVADLRAAQGRRRARILHARRSLRQLGEMTEALRAASPDGWRAVVSAGAGLIAAGDRAYFGADLRRDRVIPIFVENPAAQEIRELKGYVVPGLQAPREVERFLVYEICRQRLRDGDIALERYDLGSPGEVERALDILENVIPPGEGLRTRVWLWVNGKLLPGKDLRGESALAYVGNFRRAAAARRIDLERLRLFGKPIVPVDAGFADLLARHRDESLWMSVGVGAHDLLAAYGRLEEDQ